MWALEKWYRCVSTRMLQHTSCGGAHLVKWTRFLSEEVVPVVRLHRMIPITSHALRPHFLFPPLFDHTQRSIQVSPTLYNVLNWYGSKHWTVLAEHTVKKIIKYKMNTLTYSFRRLTVTESKHRLPCAWPLKNLSNCRNADFPLSYWINSVAELVRVWRLY